MLKAAIQAASVIEIAPPVRPRIIQQMLLFAAIYGTDAVHTDDVRRATRLGLRLAEGEPNAEVVQGLFLRSSLGFQR